MKLKYYFLYPKWKIGNSEISFIPDFGIVSKQGIYLKWFGVYIYLGK